MIGYVTVGTNDLQRAAGFWDPLLGMMGAARAMEEDNFIAWTTGEGSPMLLAIKPWDGNAATPGNGSMTGLMAASREQVDALHARALELGGTDEGAPGPRMGDFYGGYFRDLDGNKFVFFVIGQ